MGSVQIVTVILLILIVLILTKSADRNKVTSNNSAIIATVGPEPVSIDPQIGTTIDCRVYTRHMFEGLTRVDVNGNIVPGMAENWTTDETETIYTFNLREANGLMGKK